MTSKKSQAEEKSVSEEHSIKKNQLSEAEIEKTPR